MIRSDSIPLPKHSLRKVVRAKVFLFDADCNGFYWKIFGPILQKMGLANFNPAYHHLALLLVGVTSKKSEIIFLSGHADGYFGPYGGANLRQDVPSFLELTAPIGKE